LYDNGKETAYYNSLGQINHLFVSHLTRDNEFDTIICCQDKCIRLLHGSHLFLEIPLSYPVLCAAQLDLNKDLGIASTPVRSSYLVFGTTKGTLGIIQVSSTAEYQVLWEIDDGDKRSSINGIKIYDLNKDNVPEIVVGRDDGRVEVYKVNADNIQTEPTKIFSKDIGKYRFASLSYFC
jgi:Bardet-Biedl syndrome 7 protein